MTSGTERWPARRVWVRGVSSDASRKRLKSIDIKQGGGPSGGNAFGLPSSIQMTTLIYVKIISMRFLSECCSKRPVRLGVTK